jgi:hypothetical protein
MYDKDTHLLSGSHLYWPCSPWHVTSIVYLLIVVQTAIIVRIVSAVNTYLYQWSAFAFIHMQEPK